MKESEKACLRCRHCVEGMSIFDGSTILFCYDVKGREVLSLLLTKKMCAETSRNTDNVKKTFPFWEGLFLFA